MLLGFVQSSMVPPGTACFGENDIAKNDGRATHEALVHVSSERLNP
jgi:hypothetical protein